MHKTVPLLVALALSLGACSGDGADGAAPEPSPEESFPVATVLLDNGDESTLVTVEVAENPEQHELGLSGRDSLGQDEGMVFVFFEPQDDAFETRGTTIPSSIAFFDGNGTIVSIDDMRPCDAPACPAPDPGEEYMGALQVNLGAFERWDVSEGDHLQLTR